MIPAMSPTLVVSLLSLLLPHRNLFAMEIIAHRGASADAPENTLAAMKLAWQQKADAVELDLWLSRDGRLVVFHDADTRRFDRPARKISSLTWRETQQLDVGRWKGAEFMNERIPTLESILATIPQGKRAVLEIKCGPEIVPELSRVIRASDRSPPSVAIISFNFDALKASKKSLPQLDHYFLKNYKADANTGAFAQLARLIAQAKEAGFDGLDLQATWPITKSFVSEVKAAGMKLFVWTVDEFAVAKRLADSGIEGITTNRPGWLRGQLAQGAGQRLPR